MCCRRWRRWRWRRARPWPATWTRSLRAGRWRRSPSMTRGSSSPSGPAAGSPTSPASPAAGTWPTCSKTPSSGSTANPSATCATGTHQPGNRDPCEMSTSATPRNDLDPLPGRRHDSLRAPAADDVEVLMTRARVPPVLVTGATGRVGRVVVDLLIDAGVPVRALTHRSEAAATLPANVEVVTGDLTVPESLDAGLRGVSAVFLVWTALPTTAPAVVERLATYTRRVVFLSSPHRTPHPFFRQPNPMAVLHA